MPSSIPESDSASRPGALRRLTRQRGAVVGMIILAVLAAMALAAPWLSPRDPIKTAPREALQAPGSRFLLGSDQFGRDVASRALHGARLSLTVGLIAVSIAVGLGTPVGLLSGYYGGRVDGFVMRVVDVLLAFPGILVALAIVSVLSPGLNNVMIAVGLSAVPNYARLVRASTLSAREQLYVEAARALGSRDLSIVTRYILPNVVAPLIVLATLGMAAAIITGSALSFLGLGIKPPTPEWGNMLAEGREFLQRAPWVAFFPGAAIMLTVLSINLLGDGLRDALDPRMRL